MQAFNCRTKKWEYVEPAPLTDEEIAELQEQADRDAERAKVLERTRPLSFSEVQEMLVRQQINTIAVDNQTALRMRRYYPTFSELVGQKVKKGTKFRATDSEDSDIYTVIQPELTIQEHYPPGTGTESLYTRIDEQHDGTKYDPIPYNGNMALQSGKYYTQNNILYLCNRDTVNPVYNALAELVGIYVEVAYEP